MTATPLARSRCDLHPQREAAVRCPQCGRDYCRECVSEHAGRLLCRRCLERSSVAPGDRQGRRGWALTGAVAGAVVGLIVAWLFFFALGRTLLLLPSGDDAESVETQ